jgi:hypothetical protein
MSAAQASNIETIYVPLLDEGVPVVRPTRGKPVEAAQFLVLPTPDYDPEVEVWQFLPGSVVKCVLECHDGSEILVARELISPMAIQPEDVQDAKQYSI